MITILFFAGIKEEIGLERLIVEKENITVSHLKQYIQSTYPSVPFNHCMIAVNENFVADDEILKDQDIIAFIPPVSGG
ncbi:MULTISPECIES: molybdopterin converting factor subunit 1 [Priestia]|uniref:molybdopterin converting factor subunit 1 n=1 Tax=Priestia TaxID=2800373 RepID=UPI001C0C7EFF|nr:MULTISPECIES: molybdopterin converting factor subunit 1 [Priestia]MBU3568812.1 molybdopterin converting factor subunit 1 [Priestia aryabhattai]MDP1442076.1 molybdopterin converting factor subunit 1 [Priestia megaterium]MDP1471147.1 molybdopterin converting factor subunit 1 [Priestia megaterium]